jgi:Ala-tRNA(Pro) deacylase
MVVPHAPAYTAREEAAVANVPVRDWAKVVSCVIDGEAIEAVLPASRYVNVGRLLALAGGRSIRVAEENELPEMFPDCEIGAMPPFGPLYGQTVYVDASLATESQIVFNGGTHRDAMVMRWNDFVKLVNPIVGSFAE